MDDDFAKQTCKIGQMADCCKYLMMGPDGFECAKTNPTIKAAIDRRTDMHAKGDNCPGFGVTISTAEPSTR